MSNVFVSAHVVVTIAVKVLAGVTAAVSAARPNNLYTGNPRSWCTAHRYIYYLHIYNIGTLSDLLFCCSLHSWLIYRRCLTMLHNTLLVENTCSVQLHVHKKLGPTGCLVCRVNLFAIVIEDKHPNSMSGRNNLFIMPIYDYNRSLKCLCTFTQGLYLIYCSVVPRILGSLQTMFSVKRKNSH